MPASAAPEPWRHLNRGRSPLKIALLGLGLGMTGLAVATGAEPVVFVPLLLFTAGMAWPVLAARDCGIEVGAEEIVWHLGSRETRTPLAGIVRVAERSWTDGTDVWLELADGTRRDVPAPCLPNWLDGFHAALEARGIAAGRDAPPARDA